MARLRSSPTSASGPRATVDTVISGVHFLPEDPPDLVARKALRGVERVVEERSIYPVHQMPLAVSIQRRIRVDELRWLQVAITFMLDRDAAAREEEVFHVSVQATRCAPFSSPVSSRSSRSSATVREGSSGTTGI